MTGKKKNIDLFQELIRILSLKKRFTPESLESSVARIDKSYVPGNEKTEKLFDELEAYYKSQKPGKKYSFVLWMLLCSILIGIVILVPKNQYEKPKPEATQTEKLSVDTINEKEIFLEKTKQSDSLNIEQKVKSKIKLPEIKIIDSVDLELQKLRNQTLLNDSTLKKITIPDITLKEDADTLLSYMNKYCNLPEAYTFFFSDNSTVIDEIYKDDLVDFATKIKNCPIVGTIEIKASYTRKFIFFSNKKIATERIDNILKNLKRNGVTIKMLRDKNIEFIRVPRNEYTDSFDKVEILLEN